MKKILHICNSSFYLQKFLKTHIDDLVNNDYEVHVICNIEDKKFSFNKKVIYQLKKYKCNMDFYDPWVDARNLKIKYGVFTSLNLKKSYYDAIIKSVAHDKFKNMGIQAILKMCKKNHVVYDLKNIFNSKKVDLTL